jgi:hypothetical protein
VPIGRLGRRGFNQRLNPQRSHAPNVAPIPMISIERKKLILEGPVGKGSFREFYEIGSLLSREFNKTPA